MSSSFPSNPHASQLRPPFPPALLYNIYKQPHPLISLPRFASNYTSMGSSSCITISMILQPQPPSSSSFSSSTGKNPRNLPLRKIPGDYGLPFIGPLRERFDFFYIQGRDDFFRSRIRRHSSTVLRLNMPPGPFLARDPRVVALLDASSFAVLFNNSIVDKRDLFTGTYAPSPSLTGGFRVLPYLDTSESLHSPLKRFFLSLLASRRHRVVPSFRAAFGSMFDSLESALAAGKADLASFSDAAAFEFLSRSLFDVDPRNTGLRSDVAAGVITKWVLFQLGPLITLGLPPLLDDLLLRTAPLPSFLVSSDYQRLYDFFCTAAASVLDEAEKIGISREEACHNVIFAVCFNSWGGLKIFFPSLLKWVGGAGATIHSRIREEVRGAVARHGGEVTVGALAEMKLVRSSVYEALRIEPPVPMQYGRAREDLLVESHDAAFEVRKGEVLFGYQPFATRDPRVFDSPEDYVADRFVGKEGEKLLRYVVWSNGPETEGPTTENKQCAGKDFVLLAARLLLVELFLRYDSYDLELGTSPLGTSVTLTSLKKATY